MLQTENKAHQKARDRAISIGKDIYIILDRGAFVLWDADRLPSHLQPLAGYHPSGNIIRNPQDEE